MLIVMICQSRLSFELHVDPVPPESIDRIEGVVYHLLVGIPLIGVDGEPVGWVVLQPAVPSTLAWWSVLAVVERVCPSLDDLELFLSGHIHLIDHRT